MPKLPRNLTIKQDGKNKLNERAINEWVRDVERYLRENEADKQAIVDELLYTRRRVETLVAGVDDIIWRWNGVDVSEFLPAVADGFGDATIDVATGDLGNPVIEMGSATGGSARALFPVDPAYFRKPMPVSTASKAGRLIWEYFAEDFNVTNNNDGFRAGVWVGDTVDQGYGLQPRQSTNNNGVQVRCEGGTAVDVTARLPQMARIGTNAAGRQGSKLRHMWRWKTGATFWTRVECVSDSLDGSGTSGGITDATVTADYAFPTDFDDPWVPTTVGVLLRGVSATAGDTVRISELVVRQHIMDVVLP